MDHNCDVSLAEEKSGRARWQFISQGATPAEHLFYIQLALDAGCRWIQLRLKGVREPEIIQSGNVVAQLCRRYAARFILNDYPHLVKDAGADGVHLGLEDASVAAARALLGSRYLIGGTANTAGDVQSRMAEEVDYIGLGPYRFTRTKKKLSPVLGPEGYRRILGKERPPKGLRCPVYAIGGIVPDDLPSLSDTAIDGVAISGWLARMVDLTALPLPGRKIFWEDVTNQYQEWKVWHPDAVQHVCDEVKILDRLLHKTIT